MDGSHGRSAGAAMRRGGRLIAAVALAALVMAPAAEARTTVSFTFDDGSHDQLAAGTMLTAHGFRGTFYVNSAMVGSSSYYMNWDQLKQLYANGHEIGGHTLDHQDPATQSAEDQRQKVCQDRTNLLNQGFAATSFAYAFGTNNVTQAIVQGCGYNTGQVAGGLRWGSTCTRCPRAETLPPEDPFYLRTAEIRTGMTSAQLAGWITEVEKAGGGWLIFPFNRVCDDCGKYSTSPAQLDDLLKRVKSMVQAGDVRVETVQQVMGGELQPVPEGTTSTGAAPPAPPRGSGITVAGRDTVAPIIAWLEMSRKRFRVSSATTALTAAVRRGTSIRVVLSEPGLAQFRVARVVRGRRLNGRCVATTTLKRGKRCNAFKTVGTFSRTEQLTHRVKFSGRIGRKALRRGRYRLFVQATDRAGNRSKVRSVPFRIVGKSR